MKKFCTLEFGQRLTKVGNYNVNRHFKTTWAVLITGTIRVFWQKVFLSLFDLYFFLGNQLFYL